MRTLGICLVGTRRATFSGPSRFRFSRAFGIVGATLRSGLFSNCRIDCARPSMCGGRRVRLRVEVGTGRWGCGEGRETWATLGCTSDSRKSNYSHGANSAPTGEPGPLRHRVQPVRRARRGDQHHAAHPAVAGCGGHPPRPQPVGGGGRRRRDPGGRPGHRHQRLPGRARRVLLVPGGVAARARCRAHQGLRRRWRRHRPRGDRAAALARCRAHLLAARRPDARPRAHDQPDDRGVRPRADRAVQPRRAADGCGRGTRARDHAHRGRYLADARNHPQGPGARHHRHRWFRQVLAHRRAGPPVPARPAGQAAHRRPRRRPHPSPRWWCTAR